MNSFNHKKTIISLLLISALHTGGASAGMVNGTHWTIKSGDSLYKIARNIFPGDSKKQSQLRKALVDINPQVFKGNPSNISVGDKLQLPDFAISQKTPVAPTKTKVATVKPALPVKPAAIPKTPATSKTKTKLNSPKDVIGQVVINVGELSAENRGAIRKLNRRSSILRGDTISTGSEGHTQIRMKDGALLSLRPYTHLKIADYRYNGRQDGTEQSIIELLKGGFRTITGAIGHINKQNYKIRTSVATIGIRGTHYSLMLCDDNCRDDSGKKVKAGLYGGVSDGAVVVENKTGIHRFNNDQFFQIVSNKAKPIEFIKPPGVLKTSPRAIAKATDKDRLKKIKEHISNKHKAKHRRRAVIIETGQPEIANRPPIVVADLNTSTTPVSIVEPQKAPDGSAALISFSHLDANSDLTGTAAPVIVSPATNNEILIRDNILPDGTVAGKIPYAGTEFSNDPVLGTIEHKLAMVSSTGVPATLVPSSLGGNPALGVNWGRWNGEYTVLENGAPITTKDDFHFIYSENITTPTQLANVGGLYATASYSVAGGTLPTNDSGIAGTSLAVISMDVDFANSQIANYDISASVAGNNYSASASSIAFTALDRSFNIQSVSGCALNAGCSGEASVVFVGDLAQGALNTYQIQDVTGASSINGAALLTTPQIP